MYNIFFKAAYLCLLCMGSIDAYAMKRARENEQVSKDELLQQPVFITHVLQCSSLSELSHSFVCKNWYKASKQAWPKFYDFQNAYHESKNLVSPNILGHQRVQQILQKLRLAESKVSANKDEKQYLINAFLVRNFDELKVMATTPPNQIKKLFNEHPERLIQAIFLQIWLPTLVPEHVPILQKNHEPFLKILAPTDELIVSFNNESDHEIQCDYAKELCKRGHGYAALNLVREKFTDEQRHHDLKKITNIIEIVFVDKKVYISTPDYENALEIYYKNDNWPRVIWIFEEAYGKHRATSPSFWFKASEAYANQHRWEDAAKVGYTALQISSPCPAWRYFQVANCHFNLATTCPSARMHALTILGEGFEKDKDKTVISGWYELAAYHLVRLHSYKEAAYYAEIGQQRGSIRSLFLYGIACLHFDRPVGLATIQRWIDLQPCHTILNQTDLDLIHGSPMETLEHYFSTLADKKYLTWLLLQKSSK